MEVNFQCWQCRKDQVAKDVTEEVPTPSALDATCDACGHKTFIRKQTIEQWLEDRGFEVSNTSHPKWYIKDVKTTDDLQSEFTLVYQVHHQLATYQVGYYEMALSHFQQWVEKAGFAGAPRTILKVTTSYIHQEGNSHYQAKDVFVGHYGTMEAAERGITERMAWPGYSWLTREHFTVQEIDTR